VVNLKKSKPLVFQPLDLYFSKEDRYFYELKGLLNVFDIFHKKQKIRGWQEV